MRISLDAKADQGIGQRSPAATRATPLLEMLNPVSVVILDVSFHQLRGAGLLS